MRTIRIKLNSLIESQVSVVTFSDYRNLIVTLFATKDNNKATDFKKNFLCKFCLNSEEGNIKLFMGINCTDGFMKD